MAVRYDIAVGLTKGNKTTKIRRVNYKGDKKVKGLRGSSVKNVSISDHFHFVFHNLKKKKHGREEKRGNFCDYFHWKNREIFIF